MIVRCPHCDRCASARYRTGLAPETWTCTACGRSFPFFPALEIEPVGMIWHPDPAQSAPKAVNDWPGEPPPFPQRRLRHRSGWAGRATALVVGLLLILALFGQFLVHERASLAVHPEFRVLADRLCSRVPCPAQTTRHPAAIHVDLLGVVGQPPNRLQVDLELHNTLERPQPWPLLQLALSDRHGRVLGQGRWHPEQYLDPPIGTAATTGWLQPGERHRLRLEVAPPERSADGVMIWPL